MAVVSKKWKDKDGKVTRRFYAVRDVQVEGRYKRVNIAGRGMGFVKRADAEAMDQSYIPGRALPDRKMLVLKAHELFCHWQEKKIGGKIVQKTHDIYLERIKHFIDQFQYRQLISITTADIENFEFSLRKMGWKNSTINITLKQINKLLHYAMAEKWIFEKPEVKMLPVKSVNNVWRTEDQMAQFLKVANFEQIKYLVLAFFTGMRRFENFAIRWIEFDWNRGKYGAIVIDSEKNTAFKKKRIIPMNPDLRAFMYECFQKDLLDFKPSKEVPDIAFKPILDWKDPNTATRELGKLAKRVGMSLNPTMIRKSFCTNLLDKGTPLTVVSSLMGHAKITTTAKHYAGNLESHVVEAVSQLSLSEK